jgi:hypothetical protein
MLKTAAIRKRIIFSLLIVTPLGFLFKFYSGPAQWWFNNYGAGLLYIIFWIMVVSFFVTDRRLINRIPILVLVVTCALEVLQLWHPWFLEKVRSTFLGKALIGTTFVWWDFPHYFLGSLIGWVWLKRIFQLDVK